MRLQSRKTGLRAHILKHARNVGEHAVSLPIDRRFEQFHAIIDMRVGREDILPAVVVEIEHAHTPPAVFQGERPHPRAQRTIAKAGFAVVPQQGISLSG